MAALEILHFPDSRLRECAQEVDKFDDTLRTLANDMLKTMYLAPGIGLAATQVNVQKRVIVIDISEQQNEPLILINPEIISRSGQKEQDEGCLSVPGVFETVKRAQEIEVRAQDVEGHSFELQAEGLLAVCIQHEIDHLEGKLFIDYLSGLKRQRIRKRIEKEAKQKTQGDPPSTSRVI